MCENLQTSNCERAKRALEEAKVVLLLWIVFPWNSLEEWRKKHPCSQDSNLDPVKCQGEACEKGAATCLVHTEEANTTKELKTWLDKNNIVSTLNTISSFTSCIVDAKPLPAKV